MFRISRVTRMFGALALGITAGCNLVLDNEDGVLVLQVSDDASSSDPDAGLDSDATPESSLPDVAVVEEVDVSNVSDVNAVEVEDVSHDVANDAGCGSGLSICVARQTESGMQACGPCGRGIQTRTRTCAADGCGWGPWSAWGACSVVSVECMPGQVGTQSQPCGPCNTGTQSQTRTCTASCTWGAWSSFGACGNITAECMPDHWRCCAAGSWEWCYVDTCKWTGGCATCNGSCSCP